MKNTKRMIQVSFRIPKTLKEAIEKHVAADFHVNSSDFFRDALREKIQREAPHLYKQIFEEAEHE